MRNKRFTWTEQEEKFLKENYKKLKNKEIAKILNKKTKSIKDKAFLMKITSNFTYDKSFFKIPNLLNSYWAGFIAADGCLQHRENSNIYCLIIELSKNDENHLIKFKSDINYNGNIYHRFSQYNENYKETELSKIHISVNKEFFNDLAINFNLIPKKTYRLAPPLNLSEENLLAYLIGYMDGDGSICLTNRKIKKELIIGFSSASKSILNWIREFTNSKFNRCLKNKTNIIRLIPGCLNGKQFSIAGLRACHMIDFLNKIDVPKLERKWKNPEILAFIEEKKQEFPHLFIN